MTDDIISRLYDAADDHEAAVLDRLRERAGLVWTHRTSDHTWTNPAETACEQCGISKQDAAARGEL